MTPKSRKKRVMSEKEYKAALRRIDASLRRIDTLRKKSKKLEEEMAPDLEALRRYVEDE